MWDCKRLWLLFIALLYLRDVRALGVWSKRIAQDWYSVAAQIPQAQPKEPASLHDGAQISTAMRDEGFQSQNIVSYVQATSNQDVSNTALQNSYGTASVTLPSGNTVYSSMYQQRPQVPSTSQTSQSWMQNASSSSSSQSPSVYWHSPSSLSSQYLGSRGQQNVNQVSSASGLTTTQQAASSIVSSGSTSSSSSGSQSPSVYWHSPSSLSSQYLGSRGQQNVNQVSSASGLTTTQQAASSIVSSGSTSSSSSGSQSPSVYWHSPSSLSSQYLGSRGQQNVNQVSSASGLTTTQQAASSIVSSGSTSSSSSGSQSPSVYWHSPSSLSSQYLGSRGQQNVNQVSSASGLTTTQQAASSIVSSGSTSSSSSGSQSPSVYWHSPSSLSSQYLGSRGQQNVNQVSSASGLTTTQQAASSIVSSGSTSSSSSGSQSPSVYWHSPSSLSSQYLGSRGQQNVNQVSSASGLTTTQQAASSIVSSGSTSSSSSGSQSPSVYWHSPSSQSQSSTGYGLSQWLASRYGGFRLWPDQKQLSSAPALTLTQQAAESGMSSGSTTSGISSISYSGFQSPPTSWLSRISKPTSSTPTQQGINQLGSVPRLTVIQPASDIAESTGSTSGTSSSYSCSPSSTSYGQSLSSLGSHGQSVNQMSSAPGLTVTQPSTPSVVSSDFTSSSYTGSQSQPATGYGLSQWLANQYGKFQTQQGINEMSSAPGLTVTQLSMPSVASSGSTSSTSSSSSGSQSPSAYWQSASSLSKYFGSQGQQGINQMSSAPGLTVIQPASDSAVSNGSATSMPGSYTSFQSPSVYWQSPSSLSSQSLGSQGQQNVNQVSSASGLATTQQAAPSIVSSGSTSSTSSSSSGSQSPSAYWQSASSLSNYLGSQGQRVNQPTSVPGLTVIQPAFPSVVLSGSTSSSYTGSQSQDSTGYGTFQVLTSQHGSSQTPQGTNQMSSAPSLTVTQLSMPSVASSGSTSSTSSSSSGSQSPSAYWQSASSLSKYFGSQGQQGINQMSSAPGLTVIQPASDSAVSNGSATSMPGSYTSFQSPSTYWQSVSSLSSQYLGSQGRVNQLTPVPGLTVIQPASQSLVSSGSSSSPTGPQSQVSTGYGTFQVLASQHGGFQTPQGTNQMSSAPSLTLIPLASDTAVTNGSAVGTLSSYGGSQSQGSTVYGLSQGLPSQPGRLQMQLGINQRNSTPGLTTTQQAAPSIVSSGSTSSTSSAYMPSQSQSSTGHGLSQWLVNHYGSFEMWPEQNQQSSAPALTMTQQVVESGMSSGSTTSGISSIGSQSPSTSWLSGISKPTDGTPTLQGINQLASVPELSQPATVDVVTNGSTVSASGSYGVFHIQSPPAYWQSPSSLSSQYLGSQGLQSVNQLSSAPGLTVTQQAAPSVVSSGTTSTSSSPTGFQSQSTSGYWSSQELSNHHDGLQTQGTQQLNHQASSTLTSSSPNVSTSNTTTSSLGIQSKNVQKPQAFNLWMGRYPCK